MKKLIPFLILVFLLTGCSYKIVKVKSTTSNEDTNTDIVSGKNIDTDTDIDLVEKKESVFNDNKECIKYRDGIIKELGDGTDLYQIIYSQVRKSCLYSFTFFYPGIPLTWNFIVVDYLTNEYLFDETYIGGYSDVSPQFDRVMNRFK